MQARFWEFLSLPKSALEDKIFAVLSKVDENIRTCNWQQWLSGADDKQKAALFLQSFAHTITARPIARRAVIPDTGITWGDAENEGFVLLTGLQYIQIHMQGNSCIVVSCLSHSYVPACCLSCKGIELLTTCMCVC